MPSSRRPNYNEMKLNIKTSNLYNSGNFRRLTVGLGVMMSFFLLMNFHSGQTSLDDFLPIDGNSSAASIMETGTMSQFHLEDMNQTGKYHNFLASYFIQESSCERISNRDEQDMNKMVSFSSFRTLILTGAMSFFH